jgi:type I restriction enzyme S subunit
MKKYQSYKPSGVDWIGDIPTHWEVKKNRYFTISQKNKSVDGKEELLSVSEKKGVIPRTEIRDEEQTLTRSETLEGYLKVRKGDLVSNIMLMWKRGLGVSDYDGIVSPAYSVFSFVNSNPKYFHYLFRTDQYISEFRRNSRGVIESRLRLYDEFFGSLFSHFPPLKEQEQIVQYLDEKTTIIDKLISTKERKIELLKEQRTSLINEVITKGLDPNVKMKDSGVEWIGEIPESWIVGKLNFYCDRIGDGLHSTPIYDDNGEYHFINGNNIKNGKVIITENTRKVNEVEFNNHFIKLSNSHTLLLSINGTIGNVSYYNDEKVILGKSVGYINLKHSSVDIDFLYWLLLSKSIQNYFQYELTGTTIYNLSLNSIRKTPILIPSSKVQREIVEYLDNHTKEIDDLISLEQKKIELLKEYRQSLISEVITGKIKVVE